MLCKKNTFLITKVIFVIALNYISSGFVHTLVAVVRAVPLPVCVCVSARSLKTSGIGRLLVTVTEAQELKACKPNGEDRRAPRVPVSVRTRDMELISRFTPPGKSNPYCELTMGAQCYTSRPIGDTLNPKWNFNCQFFIKDLYQDILCITVFEKDQFSPDGQWRRDADSLTQTEWILSDLSTE